jgi:UDP-glucose 4-epimerase
MIISIFGGSGFLGSQVADHLSILGHKVRIFDNVKSPWLRSDQEMIMGDTLDIRSVKEAVKGAEIVYNFAGISDLDEAINEPIKTLKVNILGNANILEACRKSNIRRYIFASTVYVNSREGSYYRISKQASESLVKEYQLNYGIDYTIFRYGSIYGSRSDKHNGLFKIISHAIDTGIIRYEGNSQSMREYIHVDDVARASLLAIGEDFQNEIIVLTGQQSLRVFDMLMMLQEMMELDTEVEFIESEYKGHYVRTPYAFQLDIGRKYTPALHIDLGQGLIDLIKEIREGKSLK